MIQTINLTKRYGDVLALNDLNLQIQQGDCFGFIGVNGAGKTTTIKILATLLKPTRGQAMIDGLSVGPINARQVRSIIGYVPDYFGSYPDMVVREYLGFFAAAYNIHGQKRQQVVDDVLSLTDLGSKVDTQVNSLSRGMQQRLSLARVLLHDPKVLLLDEPASGLDPRARIEVRELLKELHRMGKTILISSHILVELADLCNKIGIIEQGELKYTGSVHEILEQAQIGSTIRVTVAQRVDEAAKLIQEVQGVVKVELEDSDGGYFRGDSGGDYVQGGEIRVMLDSKHADPAAIAHCLVTSGFALTGLTQEQVDLETAFMRLTKGLVQ